MIIAQKTKINRNQLREFDCFAKLAFFEFKQSQIIGKKKDCNRTKTKEKRCSSHSSIEKASVDCGVPGEKPIDVQQTEQCPTT